MKQISLKQLKQNLSEFAKEVSRGQPIEVTKYNKPFFYLLAAPAHAGLHRGEKAGQGHLNSVGRRASKGRFLRILEEDRNDVDE